MATTINKLAVLKCTLREPKTGNWQALLEIDVDETNTLLSGAVTLDIDGIKLLGTVKRGDIDSEIMKLEVVGGRGGLEKTIDARDYFYAGMSIVLADLMRDSGEQLDPTSATLALNSRVDKWVRARGEAQLGIAALATHLGLSWRVTRAGLVWLGAETWLPSTVSQIQGDYDPETGIMTIAPDDEGPMQLVAPGTTLDGKRVSYVETVIDGTELRQSVTFEGDDGRERGGPWTEIREFVRRLVEPGLAYARSYVGDFHFQRGDGSIDVRPASEAMRTGFAGVTGTKMRHGLPGVRVRGVAGGRVTLLFDEGSPAKPYAALWEDGTGTADLIEITVGKLVIKGDLEVSGDVTVKSLTADTDVKAGALTPATERSLLTHVHTSTAPGSPTSPPQPTPS